ncbi:MAG: endonuclease/exonuclease/phosphatase family protein [Burkholderiaceae bacterium]
MTRIIAPLIALLPVAVAIVAALPVAIADDRLTHDRLTHDRLAQAEAARPAIVEGGGVARSLRLLTFNVEHQMSAERFDAWLRYCEPARWQDPIDPATGRSRRPESLTYCNALDGTDGRGNRLFAPVHGAAQRVAKRDALRALIARAQADIVLLQEVSDAASARELLGDEYTVVSTAESPGAPGQAPIAQNIAIGWRTTAPLPVSDPEVVTGLSQGGADGRRTRPGLAVTVTLAGGMRVAILNVHLKAGCRMGRLDEAPSRDPARAERRESDCRVFQRQVPALEDWVDRKLGLGYGVVVAGDFNRDLLHEIRERLPARNDGSPRGDPPRDPGRIASLLAEISDEAPYAAWFSLVRTGDYPKQSQCHRAIDQFIVSRNVEPLLDKPLREHRVRVLPFAEPITLDRVRPSDHCPHLLALGLGHGTQRRIGR